MNSINATRAKWFAIGAAAAVAIAGGWVWLTASQEHDHIYGRWKCADPMIIGGAAFPVNNRYCLRCGWRDWAAVVQGQTKQY
jgi:hypothetical protein